MALDAMMQQRLKRLKCEIDRAARGAGVRRSPRRIAVSRRTNVVAAVNVERGHTVQSASATQHAEIRQGEQ